jgi:hypothetical protein
LALKGITKFCILKTWPKKYFEQDFGILFEDEQNLIGSSQMHLMGESARHGLVDIPIYFL